MPEIESGKDPIGVLRNSHVQWLSRKWKDVNASLKEYKHRKSIPPYPQINNEDNDDGGKDNNEPANNVVVRGENDKKYLHWEMTFQALGWDSNRQTIQKFWVYFHQINKSRSGEITMIEFLNYFNLDRTRYVEKCFDYFDTTGGNDIDFLEFMISVYNICTLDPETLVNFTFDIYDLDGDGELIYTEFELMVHELYGDPNCSKAKRCLRDLTLLAEESGGVIPLEYFSLFALNHSMLLFPIFNIQQKIQNKVMGILFWKKEILLRKQRQSKKKGKKIFTPKQVQILLRTYKTGSAAAILTHTGDPNEGLKTWFEKTNYDTLNSLITYNDADDSDTNKYKPPESLSSVLMSKAKVLFHRIFISDKKKKSKYDPSNFSLETGAIDILDSPVEDEVVKPENERIQTNMSNNNLPESESIVRTDTTDTSTTTNVTSNHPNKSLDSIVRKSQNEVPSTSPPIIDSSNTIKSRKPMKGPPIPKQKTELRPIPPNSDRSTMSKIINNSTNLPPSTNNKNTRKSTISYRKPRKMKGPPIPHTMPVFNPSSSSSTSPSPSSSHLLPQPPTPRKPKKKKSSTDHESLRNDSKAQEWHDQQHFNKRKSIQNIKKRKTKRAQQLRRSGRDKQRQVSLIASQNETNGTKNFNRPRTPGLLIS